MNLHSNTHDLSVRARGRLHTLVLVEVVRSINSETVTLAHRTHVGASSHLSNVGTSIAIHLRTVSLSTLHALHASHTAILVLDLLLTVVGLGVTDNLVVLVDVDVDTTVVQVTTDTEHETVPGRSPGAHVELELLLAVRGVDGGDTGAAGDVEPHGLGGLPASREATRDVLKVDGNVDGLRGLDHVHELVLHEEHVGGAERESGLDLLALDVTEGGRGTLVTGREESLSGEDGAGGVSSAGTTDEHDDVVEPCTAVQVGDTTVGVLETGLRDDQGTVGARLLQHDADTGHGTWLSGESGHEGGGINAGELVRTVSDLGTLGVASVVVVAGLQVLGRRSSGTGSDDV